MHGATIKAGRTIFIPTINLKLNTNIYTWNSVVWRLTFKKKKKPRHRI